MINCSMRKMVSFSLTLVRHGETVANKTNIIQGQQDTALSDTGWRQAQLIALRLQNDHFTHVFASDLGRAAQTAKKIMELNRGSKCEIVHDKRLRERGFGCVEGKPYKALVALQRSAHKSLADFTPTDGETIAQVHERSQAFFVELCEKMRTYIDLVDTDYTPASIRRRYSSPLSRPLDNNSTSNRLSLEAERTSFIDLNSLTRVQEESEDDVSTDLSCDSVIDDTAGHSRVAIKRRHSQNDDVSGNHDATSSTIFFNDLSKALSDQMPGGDVVVVDTDPDNDSAIVIDDHVARVRSKSEITRCNSSGSEGYTSLSDTADNPHGQQQPGKDNNINVHSSQNRHTGKSKADIGADELDSIFAAPVNDNDDDSEKYEQRSHNLQLYYSNMPGGAGSGQSGTCPNVTISPMLGCDFNRLSSMSSVSSGRNGSFDDTDGFLSPLADVLIVSHGVWLKELIKHFIENLGCSLSGGKGFALRISPNTGLSRFTVTLGENSESPVITCLLLHDKDHLLDLGMTEAEGKY